MTVPYIVERHQGHAYAYRSFSADHYGFVILVTGGHPIHLSADDADKLATELQMAAHQARTEGKK